MTFFQFIRNTRLSTQFAWLLASGVLAYFCGGFVAGMFWCSDCGTNIPGRLLVSAVMGILSIIFLGFPPADESGHNSLDAWPYIFACWVLIYLGISHLDYRRSVKKQRRT